MARLRPARARRNGRKNRRPLCDGDFRGFRRPDQRKLVRSVQLARAQLLSREFAVVGIAAQSHVHRGLPKKVSEDMKQFATGEHRSRPVGMVRAPDALPLRKFDDPATYPKLKQLLEKVTPTVHSRQLLLLSGTATRRVRAYRREPGANGSSNKANDTGAA